MAITTGEQLHCKAPLEEFGRDEVAAGAADVPEQGSPVVWVGVGTLAVHRHRNGLWSGPEPGCLGNGGRDDESGLLPCSPSLTETFACLATVSFATDAQIPHYYRLILSLSTNNLALTFTQIMFQPHLGVQYL